MTPRELATVLAQALANGDESARPALIDLLLEQGCPRTAKHLRDRCHYPVQDCSAVAPFLNPEHTFATVETHHR